MYICNMLNRNGFMILVLCLSAAISGRAQIPNGQGGFVVPCVIIDGDTIPLLQLDEVEIFSKRFFRFKRDAERYKRLVFNVRKTYPYAKLAGEKYRHYDSILARESHKRSKDKLMKQAEKEIKKQFEAELKNLTISQGKVLVKLLDRETSHSAFALVKDLRSVFQAYLYQGIGRLFGYNLKTKYDPNGRDQDIETIVRMIEQGTLQPIPTKTKQSASR